MVTGEEMKKCLPLLLLFLLCLSQPVESKKEDLRYQIVFDSEEKDTLSKKKEILAMLRESLDSLYEESYGVFLKEIADELTTENRRVVFENNLLLIQLGDHKGIRIEGNIVKNSFCMAEVKPKSFLRKLFGF